MYFAHNESRRHFLKSTFIGGIAAISASRFAGLASAAGPSAPVPAAAPRPLSPLAAPARVALTTGGSRADNTFRALRFFEKEIAQAIGNRRVIVKPNNVSTTIQLAATHAESFEGILDFLKSINKLENAVIAESAAGPTLTGFDNFKYPQVAGKYGVKLIDLDKEASEVLYVLDERDYRPKPVRMSKLLLDPNSFIISAAKLKTHDRVVATLSLKNIVVGAPIKDAGPRGRSDKPIVHGNGIYGINFNLFTLAQRLHPHLAVIDGFEGMEGNGPTSGTPVDHRVCVASLDWLAADRVGVELMGIDFANLGYLNYAADASLGQADLAKIEVLGEEIAKHVKPYKLARGVEQQLMWMTPPKRG